MQKPTTTKSYLAIFSAQKPNDYSNTKPENRTPLPNSIHDLQHDVPMTTCATGGEETYTCRLVLQVQHRASVSANTAHTPLGGPGYTNETKERNS
jgi:hypothetical protein